jgi:co-chaperonin GroES (HSP10)
VEQLPIPVGDRVLVEMIISDKSEGGLILPEEVGITGVVMSIGRGVPEWFTKDSDAMWMSTRDMSRGVRVGDTVHLARGMQSGTEFKVNGKLYLLVASNMIGAIIDGNS